ncbi:MAG: BspA family leucine-rich repeat surface protein [Coriobacteriia bacterium]|nr:BspA family leucine-rich repeat surface protein [Coriobacteriia bacterium]
MKNIKMKLFVSLCSICALAFCISMCVIGLNQTGEADKPSQFAQSESTTTSNNIQEQHALKNNSQTLSSQACVPENIADKPSGHVVKIDSSEMEKIVNDYQEDVVNVKSNISTNLFRQKTDPDDIGWRIDKDSEGYNVLHVGKPENYHNTFESTFAEYQLHGWYNWRTMIDKVVIDEEVSFKSCKSLFGCIDKDTSGSVKLMDIRQFEGLDKIDLTDSKFNGDASYMFVGCDWANTNSLPKGLENVTNAKAMFNYTAVSEAKQGNGFSNDIMHKAAFELTGATNLEFALANNKLFKDFDGSKLKYDDRDFNMSYMLYNDPKVLEIDIRGWTSFPEDKEKFEMWTGKIINIDDVYVYCDATIRETVRESLPQSTSTGQWKLEEPTAYWGVTGMGTNRTLYLSALKTPNATTENPNILKGFSDSARPWSADYENITSVIIEENIHLKFTGCQSLFESLKYCLEISGLKMLDTSKADTMRNMFYDCQSLTQLDLSSFRTDNLTNMTQFCGNCNNLTQLNLTSFNTEKVTLFVMAFEGCSKLTQLDLSSFSNKSITEPGSDMYSMFDECNALKIIMADPKKWERKTSTLTISAFENCTNLVGHSKSGHSTPFTSDDVKYACVDVDDENPGYFTDVDYHPVEPDYLTFDIKANESTFSVERYGMPMIGDSPDLWYRHYIKSTDKWTDWSELKDITAGEKRDVNNLQTGDKIQLRGNNPNGFNSDEQSQVHGCILNFHVDKDFELSGNIMTLLGYDTVITDIPNEFCFECLFDNNEHLIKVSENLLPSTNLQDLCYEYMFSNCTSLESAPNLPAQDINKSKCYRHMFDGCSKLNNISVGFKAFPREGEHYSSTDEWMKGVAETGTFNYIGEGTPEYRDEDYNNPSAVPWAKPTPVELQPLQFSSPDRLYRPIFVDNQPPANVTFYDADKNPIENVTKMEQLKDASYYSGTGQFKAIWISETESWNQAFDPNKTKYPEAGTANEYLGIYKELGDYCENLNFTGNKDETILPKIDNIPVSDIRAQYNIESSAFVGCKSIDSEDFCFCNDDGEYHSSSILGTNRDGEPYSAYIFSREFNKQEPPVDWLPMQAEAGDHSVINFYPAFNKGDATVASYRFAVKKGNTYTKISNENISMSNICAALTNAEISDSKTLYYQKFDDTADALKCYTVKDMSWNSVFINSSTAGIPKAYDPVFDNDYCKVGIYAAELGIVKEDGSIDNPFGTDWNVMDTASNKKPSINNVKYADNEQSEDFYNSYGKKTGGILSQYSHFVWGSCAYDLSYAFLFSVEDSGEGQLHWTRAGRGDTYTSIVLAKEFGNPQPSTHTVSVEPVEEGHGTITGGPFTVPAGTTYTVDNVNKKIVIGSGDDMVIQYTDGGGYTLDKWMIGEEEAESGTITGDITFTAQTKAIDLKPLTLRETIGGEQKDVRYFPIAGDSLDENITFYDQYKNPVEKTGPDGKYQQSDLGESRTGRSLFCVSYYSGEGSFKTVRTATDKWDNVFVDESGQTYPYEATKLTDTFQTSKLVDKKEGTEYVYRIKDLDNAPTIEGTTLQDIWISYNWFGFGTQGWQSQFWCTVAPNSSQAYVWQTQNSLTQCYPNGRNDGMYSHILIGRTFNAPQPSTHEVSVEPVEEGHGTITGGPFDVPEGTSYTVDNVNKKITIGSGDDKVIQYTDGDDWIFDKWMIGEEEAESGTVTGDITFKAQTKEKPVLKSLDIDGVHYFPVVTKFKGVTFYDESQQEIKPAESTGYEVSDLKNAHYYSGDAPFKAVRSINTIDFDTLYPEQAKSGGVKKFNYNSNWAKSNLKYDNDNPLETVEGLVNDREERDIPPKIDGVSLTDIWKSYNPSASTNGFGGNSGSFWSCEAYNVDYDYAWCWRSQKGGSGEWTKPNRVTTSGKCVCVSRVFN